MYLTKNIKVGKIRNSAWQINGNNPENFRYISFNIFFFILALKKHISILFLSSMYYFISLLYSTWNEVLKTTFNIHAWIGFDFWKRPSTNSNQTIVYFPQMLCDHVITSNCSPVKFLRTLIGILAKNGCLLINLLILGSIYKTLFALPNSCHYVGHDHKHLTLFD